MRQTSLCAWLNLPVASPGELRTESELQGNLSISPGLGAKFAGSSLPHSK